MSALHPGSAVMVSTERGDEPGTIVAATHPASGEQILYTVCFADRTRSCWSENRVREQTSAEWVAETLAAIERHLGALR